MFFTQNHRIMLCRHVVRGLSHDPTRCYSWQAKMHVDHRARLPWLTCLATHLVWINYFCLLIWGIRLLAITVYHGHMIEISR